MSAIAWTERTFSGPEQLVAALMDLFDERGGTHYDAGVTQREHALGSADLARQAGAPGALVVAALLHDIGHLLLDEHDAVQRFLATDLRHEAVGAQFLRRWFPPAVAGPVALHVRAKRYLVAVTPDYAARLSASSQRSLAVQGGPLSAAAAAAFAALPHAEAAIAVRRWDDEAKTAGRAVPSLDAFSADLRAQADLAAM